MTTPGAKWQLLLMADDGRIVPFRRFKGLLIALFLLFLLLGLGCAGLGWWLVSEKSKHGETRERLSVIEKQVASCLEALETTLPVSIEEEVPTIVDDPTIEHQSGAEPSESGSEANTPAAGFVPETGSEDQPEPVRASEKTVAPVAEEKVQSEEDTFQREATVQEEEPQVAPTTENSSGSTLSAAPMVALGESIELMFSKKNKVLKVRFRIKNAGSSNSPVQGRCVVILKPDGSGVDAWLTLPNVTLINGEPTGNRGSRFKISRFMDMTVKAVGAANPSNFSTATVYVFDSAGNKINERIYPVQ